MNRTYVRSTCAKEIALTGFILTYAQRKNLLERPKLAGRIFISLH